MPVDVILLELDKSLMIGIRYERLYLTVRFSATVNALFTAN